MLDRINISQHEGRKTCALFLTVLYRFCKHPALDDPLGEWVALGQMVTQKWSTHWCNVLHEFHTRIRTACVALLIIGLCSLIYPVNPYW